MGYNTPTTINNTERALSDKQVLSVAEIARRLDVPESTVHYWKNRFAQHLPSVGAGRQKRFRPEAVEVFAVIAEMLGAGHPAAEVMDILAQRYPLTPTPVPAQPRPVPGSAPALPDAEILADVARTMGTEIARSIGDYIGRLLDPDIAQSQQDVRQMREEVDHANALIARQYEELEALRGQNGELRGKMTVLENELVRLRKDRREMEKYLLDKIRSVTT
jgi:DNA-binding transcriptional MerR regulator